MRYKHHRAIIVAETCIVRAGMDQLLNELGARDWSTDTKQHAEELIEVAGRLCYKSFDTSLNLNLTRVREGNQQYLSNVLNQKHGSVFEHATVSIALLNVSRILTHELVRHRPGTAYSQESLRFVRLDDFGMYDPWALSEDYIAEKCAENVLCDGTVDERQAWAKMISNQLKDEFVNLVKQSENLISSAAERLGLNTSTMSFHTKKMITSALRRWAPSGMTTNILVTCNHRTWRHLIEQRTAFGAEEEIREVFYNVGNQLRRRYPNIYQDIKEECDLDGGCPRFYFLNSKI